ncbi:hypothetical protein ACPPVT_16480 [Angustibacter sp. McL0619]|uniref:hypothetical protein n=1 Tax=Angustibacter sp. McL0619 TaxID=3415676 RepID=UPI003CF86185
MPTESGTADLARAVLASLPLSFAERSGTSASAPGAVVIIDGGPGWPEHVAAAAHQGAAGVVVVQPEPTDCSRLLATLVDTAVPLVFDSPWVANPAVSDAAGLFGPAAVPGSRLECRIILQPGRDLAAALLHQLALVRQLVGPATEARLLTWSEQGYALQATTGDCMLDLSVVTTRAVPESALARLLTSDGSIELFIPSPDTARPAKLTTVGPSGSLLAPTVYESGHRASWRRLHALITSGDFSAGVDELQALQDDAAEVTSVLSQHVSPAVRTAAAPSPSHFQK